MPSDGLTGGAQSVEELRRQLADARRRAAPTSEVLRVITDSPTTVRAVLDTVAKSAASPCDAEDAAIFRRDGDRLPVVAHHGPIAFGPVGEFSFPLTRGTTNG